MISDQIISKFFFIVFENMISKVDIKSMLKYGYERDLGLECRLLRGSKQNCGH